MRPQPGNALQEGREKKGDSDTDLRGEISVLLLFFSSLLLLRVLARGEFLKDWETDSGGASDTDLRGEISVLLLFSSSPLLFFSPRSGSRGKCLKNWETDSGGACECFVNTLWMLASTL